MALDLVILFLAHDVTVPHVTAKAGDTSHIETFWLYNKYMPLFADVISHHRGLQGGHSLVASQP